MRSTVQLCTFWYSAPRPLPSLIFLLSQTLLFSCSSSRSWREQTPSAMAPSIQTHLCALKTPRRLARSLQEVQQ